MELTTTIHLPGLVSPTRKRWTGTLADALKDATDGRAGALIERLTERGVFVEPDEDADDERDLTDVAEHLTIEDVRYLADDPNARIVGAETRGEVPR